MFNNKQLMILKISLLLNLFLIFFFFFNFSHIKSFEEIASEGMEIANFDSIYEVICHWILYSSYITLYYTHYIYIIWRKTSLCVTIIIGAHWGNKSEFSNYCLLNKHLTCMKFLHSISYFIYWHNINQLTVK